VRSRSPACHGAANDPALTGTSRLPEPGHAGLAVTIALTAAGVVVAMIALRRTGTAPVPAPEPAELATALARILMRRSV